MSDTKPHLSPSKDQLSRITDNAPIMLAEIDASLHYTFVNAPYAAMFGKTAQDIIGLSVDSLLGQEAFEKTRVNTQKVLNGEPVRYDLRLPRVDAQGNDFIKVMDVSYSPHFDETGRVVSYIATIVDKTAESLALKKVDDLNIKLRTALDLSLNGFVVIRSVRSDAGEIIDFDYVYANPKAEEIGGTSLVGHRLLELFPGNKEMGLYDAYVDVVETGDIYIKELNYQLDGLDFWLEISASRLDDGCALSFKDISDRKNTETHNKLLLNELHHRVKNTLATVQSMASQTANHAETIKEFEEKFQPRLRSISDAHDILLNSEHGRASLQTMINQQLRPHISIDSGRLSLEGINVLLPATSAHALGLILHELATNAVKYGALSNQEGTVKVSWEQKDTDVLIHWQERGGPKVSSPKTQGFGSLLIEESLKYGLGGDAQLHFDAKGLKVDIRLPLK